MHVTYFCYNPMNLVTMTTKLLTGRGLLYCLQFSINLFDLGVEDQGQINDVMMVHNTSSNGHAPIQQIPLTYLEIQKSYGPDKFCQLFDLGGLKVKVK